MEFWCGDCRNERERKEFARMIRDQPSPYLSVYAMPDDILGEFGMARMDGKLYMAVSLLKFAEENGVPRLDPEAN